jgi:chromosomal replication initiation ATPase DnaA
MRDIIKKIMWISGRCGYGKTEFANSIIKELEEKNKKICKLDGKEFIDIFIKNLKDRNPVSVIISYFQNYDLIVIDNIDYCLTGKLATQKEVKEIIRQIINNNKTIVFLISQRRARKTKKLKFDSDECSYLRLKAPSAELKRSLVRKWFKNEGLIIPTEKVEEVINNSNNLFQLKGSFTKIKFFGKQGTTI